MSLDLASDPYAVPEDLSARIDELGLRENVREMVDQVLDDVLFTNVGLAFLILGSAIGFCLAVLAFAVSAVSLPMLIDRPVGVFAAVATSVAAVRVNIRPMALWAVLIAGFTALGLVTFYLGLIVVLPLIGHATWHAYRDLVESAE